MMIPLSPLPSRLDFTHGSIHVTRQCYSVARLLGKLAGGVGIDGPTAASVYKQIKQIRRHDHAGID